MTVRTSTATAAGAYTIVISLVVGGLIYTTVAQLVVTQVLCELGFSVSPSLLVVPQGSYGSAIASLFTSCPFLLNETFTLGSSVPPAGIRLSFSPRTITPQIDRVVFSNVTVAVDRATPLGNYSITLTVTVLGLVRYETLLVTVIAPRCLIATATYGSELAPEVQFLRQFRDNKVMRTYSGSQFMLAFNSWYYSFSPKIATWIADSETARSLMRAALYPLIGTLTISSSLFDLFSFNTEFAALVAGIAASSLLGAIYLTLPIIIVLRAAKRRMNRKALLSILGIGLALALLGTLSNGTSGLMQILTSVVVLESTLLAPSILADGILAKFGWE